MKSKADSKPRRRDRMPDNERVALGIGIGVSVILALFFGAIVVVLRTPSGPSDPDAPTPVIPPDYPRQLVDFSLIDQTGRPFTRKQLDGKIVVVNFIFTSCSAVCPYVNAQMEKVQQLTAGRSDVKLISLTMDPVDDTAPVLARYAQDYGQDATRWSFLTGDEAEMHRLVGAGFLPPDTTGEFAYMPGSFAHTQRIALLDGRGRLVEYFDGLNQNAGQAVAQAIARMTTSSP